MKVAGRRVSGVGAADASARRGTSERARAGIRGDGDRLVETGALPTAGRAHRGFAERLIRRFQEFCESYPWEWTPADVEDFTVSLTSGQNRLALSTIRAIT